MTADLIAELKKAHSGLAQLALAGEDFIWRPAAKAQAALDNAIAAVSAQQAMSEPAEVAKLRQIAQQAAKVAPGSWEADQIDSEDGRGRCQASAVFCDRPYHTEGRTALVDTINTENALMEQDDDLPRDENGRVVCDHIATFDPPTVLRLLAALKSAPSPAPVGPDPEAKLLAYQHSHETAVDLGYPSLTEALEHLSELKAALPVGEEEIARMIRDELDSSAGEAFDQGGGTYRIFGKPIEGYGIDIDVGSLARQILARLRSGEG